jgi:hypothetical protein
MGRVSSVFALPLFWQVRLSVTQFPTAFLAVSLVGPGCRGRSVASCSFWSVPGNEHPIRL